MVHHRRLFNNIMLVEDDEDDQQFFLEALKAVRENASIANNGEEALHLLRQAGWRPDFIFLDLNMPRINGKQFLEGIKGNELWSNIPVIVYSTSSFEEEKRACVQAGATGFIVKPFSFAALCETLSTVFNSLLASHQEPH